MQRLIRIAVSSAIVLVAYWTYALVVVPRVEPPAKPRSDDTARRSGRSNVPGIDPKIEQIRPLFAPDAWELTNPKILESEQAKLLMREYHNLGDGRVQISPCTLIFLPDDPIDDDAERLRQAVVLEIPEGAILEFDEPFDLRRMKIGKLVGGELSGRVTIRSAGRDPGPQDDLRIVTRDVELTEKHIWTPHPVAFQLGPNYGRGRDMRIKLLPANEDANGNGDHRGPNIGGIELFELKHIDRLHIEPPPQEKPQGSRVAQQSAGLDPTAPVEITCRGPFRFDLIDKVATFEDQVDVMRIHRNGPCDQLSCELLSLFFVERNPDKGKAKSEPGKSAAAKNPKPSQNDSQGRVSTSNAASTSNTVPALNLEPSRIEARGNPVIISAPSLKVQGQGQRLEYDLINNRVVLDGTDEVSLKQNANEIHARSLDYQWEGPGRIGRIVADGPGWLRGQMDDRPEQQLEARWTKQLLVRPHEQNQVISLTGGSGVKFPGIGELSAAEIHLWLQELPNAKGNDQPNIRPDRMLARHDVRLASAELSGAVNQLEVWFEEAGDLPRVSPTDVSPGGVNTPIGPPLAGGMQPSPYGGVYGQQVDGSPQQHFHVEARLVRVKILTRGGQTDLDELMLEDGVRLVETQTRRPDEKPVVVTGNRVHVVDASLPHAAVTIIGAPAQFEGRGLSAQGTTVTLNRGTNRLVIDGAGQMSFPLDRGFDGQPLPTATSLKIDWQDRMEFDGQTARFEELVTACTPQQTLRTETLEVSLRQAIRFSELQQREEPEIEQILCRGGVFMESRTYEDNVQTGHEQFEVTDMAINLLSGATTAGGPGWLSSVRRGGDPTVGFAMPGAKSSPTPAAPSDTALRGLFVRFQGTVAGNLHHRQLTFQDQVRVTYGPVESWELNSLDTANPETLGANGAVMHCDRLTVTQMTDPLGGKPGIELVADGNTVVEGTSFTARGVRISYAESKDLLILEGDGRTDAELFRQTQVGGQTSRAAAQKILFWPKSRRLKIDGARSFELSGLSAGGPFGQR